MPRPPRMYLEGAPWPKRRAAPHGSGLAPGDEAQYLALRMLNNTELDTRMRNIEAHVFNGDAPRRLLRYAQLFAERHGLNE